ncbi:hypothetical protein MNBD_GAMMA12-21 [hydrothermal vent metagenome]|uniref:Glutaredoxin domain-containing protein n=1 Tax=hydrothermal vent metagenome TaxID=652676 RepID=A0A3B0Y830_9ZZZZ
MTHTKNTENTLPSKKAWTGNRILNLFLNIALIGLIVWYGYKYHGLLYPTTRVSDENKARIIMYSTKWCPYCIEARAMFAKNGIAYYDYNIDSSKDGKEQFFELGGRGVPLFLIDNKVIHGLQKSRIADLLNKGKKISPIKKTNKLSN